MTISPIAILSGRSQARGYACHVRTGECPCMTKDAMTRLEHVLVRSNQTKRGHDRAFRERHLSPVGAFTRVFDALWEEVARALARAGDGVSTREIPTPSPQPSPLR